MHEIHSHSTLSVFKQEALSREFLQSVNMNEHFQDERGKRATSIRTLQNDANAHRRLTHTLYIHIHKKNPH